MVSGIGQAGKLPHYTQATCSTSCTAGPCRPPWGPRSPTPELIVIAESGDGDAYGEGGNHWMHAMRRNHDITYLVHDNQVYGLTKGQTSPTSDPDFVTKSTPYGRRSPSTRLPIAIACDASFVARSFAGDPTIWRR